MQTKVFAIFVLAMFLFVGSAMATQDTTQSDTQHVSAIIQPYTVTLTAPIDIEEWILERGINNEKDIGPVYISTTAPTFYLMKLNVTSSTDRLRLANGTGVENAMYISNATPPVPEEYGPNGWVQLFTGILPVLRIEHTATPTPVEVPIRLRQYISYNDTIGNYDISFTYTLSVISPAEENLTPPSPPT
jgi:hypothetical protein